MLDPITVKELTEQKLQDLVQSIERKIPGISPNNQAAYDLMIWQKEVIMNELQERRLIESLKATQLESINLTVDPLSEKEDYEREKKRQSGN